MSVSSIFIQNEISDFPIELQSLSVEGGSSKHIISLNNRLLLPQHQLIIQVAKNIFENATKIALNLSFQAEGQEKSITHQDLGINPTKELDGSSKSAYFVHIRPLQDPVYSEDGETKLISHVMRLTTAISTGDVPYIIETSGQSL